MVEPIEREAVASGKVIEKAESGASDDLIKALGLLTVNFNMLEQVLAFVIWQLLGVDNQDVGRIATADLSYRFLVDKFYALSLQRGGPLADRDLDKLRGKLVEVGDQRNRFIHSVWGGGEGLGATLAFKSSARGKRGLQTTFGEIEPKEVVAVVDEIATLTGSLLRLLALQDPSPEPIGRDEAP